MYFVKIRQTVKKLQIKKQLNFVNVFVLRPIFTNDISKERNTQETQLCRRKHLSIIICFKATARQSCNYCIYRTARYAARRIRNIHNWHVQRVYDCVGQALLYSVVQIQLKWSKAGFTLRGFLCSAGSFGPERTEQALCYWSFDPFVYTAIQFDTKVTVQ